MRPCWPILTILAVIGHAQAADMLLLRQTPEESGTDTVEVMLDRERISLVRLERRESFEHRVEVTLAPEDEPQLRLRCADLAAARQVMEALRPGSGGPTVLDLTGRCRF